MKDGKLTTKQKSFVNHYCSNGGNGTQAAISAGYSVKVAGEVGSENLMKPHIKAEIDKYHEKSTMKLIVTAEEVAKGLLDIAQQGEKDSDRVAAYKTLTNYTGGFDKNQHKVDLSSKDGTMAPRIIELVVPTDDNGKD